MKINEIIELTRAELIGNTTQDICSLNRIEYAGIGEITFYAKEKYLTYLQTSNATAILVPSDWKDSPKENQVFLKVPDPYGAFLQLVLFFDSRRKRDLQGIHSTAIIESSAQLSDNVFIGSNCYIGDNVIIGENTIIYSNSVIERNSFIGNNTIIYPNVSIYEDTKIGDRCIIHSGAVIGSDGFGFIENSDKSFTKIPQIGNVVIEDEVEIGANTTIDRAFVGSTIIRKGTKLDNLIQIAHNDDIGENTAMAAQVGVSGTVKIGNRVRLGGQAGIAGHLEIGDDVIILAQSGVPSSITQPGVYVGSPPRNKMHAFKIEAVINNLPEMYKDIKRIKNKLELD